MKAEVRIRFDSETIPGGAILPIARSAGLVGSRCVLSGISPATTKPRRWCHSGWGSSG
jgi:hypothetical protein